jgi:hypothetical protein
LNVNECNFNDIINLLSTHLFKECNDLCVVNIAQVHSFINLLVKSNIPFTLSFDQRTNSSAKVITIQIYFTPTTSITKIFQLEEGNIS